MQGLRPGGWRNRGSRVTNDQVRLNAMFDPSIGRAGDHGAKGLQGRHADLAARDGDGGQGRLGVLRKANIIKADDGQLPGDDDSAIVGGVHSADGHEVIGRNDSGCLKVSQQLRAGQVPALNAKIRVDGPGLNARNSLKARLESTLAAPGGRELGRAADEPDAPMAQLPDMIERGMNAAFIIDRDVAHVAVDTAQIKINSTDATRSEGLSHAWINLGSQNGHARHPQTEQAIDTFARALSIVIGVHYDGFHVALIGSFLEGRQDFGEEWIANVGNNHAEDLTAAGSQTPRGNIRGVAQRLYRSQHFALGLWTDAMAMRFVQDKRDGRNRNPGTTGNIADVGSAIARGPG